MAKKQKPEIKLAVFQLLSVLALVETSMLLWYRIYEPAWLRYPMGGLFVLMLGLAAVYAPRLLAAVFGAIFAMLLCALVLIGLPVLLLMNTEPEPNPLIIALAIAWLFASIGLLAFGYMRVEAYLLERLVTKQK